MRVKSFAIAAFLFFVALAFCQTVSPQFVAIERAVSFENDGQTLCGILTLPETGDRPFPVVLLLHGFLGHMNDLEVRGTGGSMYEMTAEHLAGAGLASLRFDFRGSGISEGSWEETTFSGQISDTIAAISFLESLPEIDKRKIAVLGLSQGGLVAACVAARDVRVRSVVLWSAVAIPVYTYSALLGADAVGSSIKAAPGEPILASISWGGTTVLKKEFFDELFTVDPVAEVARYDGPLMVVSGLTDAIVFPQPQSGRIFIDYHEGPERLFLQNSGHIYDLFEGKDHLEEVIDESIQWLLETL